MIRKAVVAVSIALVMCLASAAATVTMYTVTPETARQAENILVGWLRNARTNVDLVVPTLPYGAIGSAIIDAAARGVTVRAILEADDEGLPDVSTWISTYGIPAALETSTAELLHQFILVDGEIVLVGPFSQLESPPQRAYLDLLVIDCRGDSSSGSVAARYEALFEALWSQFAPFSLQTEVAEAASPQPGYLFFFDVDAAGECIELVSTADTRVDIAGWAISDLEGRYVFPPETYLEPNEPFRICIAEYNPTYDPQGVYLNDEHDEIYLSSPEGDIVDEVVW